MEFKNIGCLEKLGKLASLEICPKLMTLIDSLLRISIFSN